MMYLGDNMKQKYEFYQFEDPQFPIEFEYHHQKQTEYKQSSWHNQLELIYLVSGKAELLINQEKFILNSGEIGIINCNSIHSINALSANVHYYSLIIDHNYCSENNFDVLNNKFNPVSRNVELKNILQIISNEMTKLKPYYKDSVKALSISILVILFRTELSNPVNESRLSDSKIKDVSLGIDFIHENYMHDINLDDIAYHVKLSKYHYSRIFKEISGKTINEYLILVRCKQANHLITTSDHKLSSIAQMTGFQSASYFNKVFKKVYGSNPSDLRKKSRQIV